MRGFEARGGAAVASLDEDERAVIARIVADVALLLGAEPFGHEVPSASRDARGRGEDLESMLAFLDSEEAAIAPDDPALLRLLPDAAPTDGEVSAEFRRLTQGDITRLKVERLRWLWEELGRPGPDLEVPADQVMACAATLTDVRLVLAARLGLETDDDAERLHADLAHAHDERENGPTIDPERIWLGMLYDALTWLQETLVTLRLGGHDE